MLKQQVFWGSIIGFFFVCIIGTINHFVYELSGDNIIAGLITPIDESVWEHLKLLFFPFLIFTLGEFLIYGKKLCGFIMSRLIGVISGLIFIPTIFYIYSSVVGKSIVVIDIMIFFVSVFVSYLISWIFIQKQKNCKPYESIIGIILFLIFAALFFIFTFI